VEEQTAAEYRQVVTSRPARIFGNRTSPTRRVAAAALAVVAATCIALGLMEGLTRLFFPAFDPSGRFEFRHRMGPLWLGQPGAAQRQIKNTGDYDVAVRINRHGLRDTKDIAEATAGDLVVVGDSFAWGWGVEAEQRFSDRLQALTGRPTFNLTTPTNIAGYEALLDYAKSLGAQIGQVVVAVCLENDLAVYVAADEPADDPVVGWKEWLAERSAAYLLLTTLVHQTPWLNTLAVRAGVIIPNLEGISKNDYEPEAIASSADKLQDLSKRYRLLVVLIPSRALWVGENRAAEDRVHKDLVAALVKRGVAVLDLRPLLEKGGAPLSYHFANDGHWTARGHALAAEAIAECLAGRADACR
jgi:lysophospholipase L1-like esterase